MLWPLYENQAQSDTIVMNLCINNWKGAKGKPNILGMPSNTMNGLTGDKQPDAKPNPVSLWNGDFGYWLCC